LKKCQPKRAQELQRKIKRYALPVKQNVKIADMVFAFDNHNLINMLTKRGKAIASLDWKGLEEA